jgi:hypothetical protein
MLHGDLLHQQNYTGADKIIAIMDAGFGSKYDTAFSKAEITIEFWEVMILYCETQRYTLQTRTEQTFFLLWEYTEGKLVGTAPDASYYLFTEDVRSEK